MFQRIVIAIFEATTPGTPQRLPVLTQDLVILGFVQVFAVLEQIQVDRQALLVGRLGVAIAFLYPDITVQPWITVRIPYSQFKSVLISELNEQAYC